MLVDKLKLEKDQALTLGQLQLLLHLYLGLPLSLLRLALLLPPLKKNWALRCFCFYRWICLSVNRCCLNL